MKILNKMRIQRQYNIKKNKRKVTRMSIDILIKLFTPYMKQYQKRVLLSKIVNRLNILNIPLIHRAIILLRAPNAHLLSNSGFRMDYTKDTVILIKLFTHILKQKPKSVTKKFRQRRARKAMKSKAKVYFRNREQQLLLIKSTAFLVIFIKLFIYNKGKLNSVRPKICDLEQFLTKNEVPFFYDSLPLRGNNRGIKRKHLLPRRRRARKAMKSKAKRMRRDDSNEKPEKTN